ncbi:MAG: dihydrolipoyl dehydrogenase [Bacteroidales bacterium]|nr:dihydrolipoyl dehydrogenase [Bacteroidales bacterium]MDD2424501.1 dihydrolipoyl dehydrogenase [Bacteroidales bacterium]MDD3988517.1 dihydrolipoyl dehydrogenase [Bacteroidales bacterium]MDD4638204.1 dihydrolipoyl dehydrogenase [Bacteroidales bacterium]
MYDIVIIGSGPAGYVAAIRAGQLGLRCAIVEKNSIGGMCLNWGCIPSKAMLESVKLYQRILNDSSRFGIEGIEKKNLLFNWNSALKRAVTIVKRLTGGVEFLLKKNGVEIITGEAKIVSSGSVLVNNQLLKTKNIIIATGSTSPAIETNVENLVAEPLSLFTERDIPSDIVVRGNGPIAIELAQLFSFMGRKVTLVSESGFIMPKADNYIRDFMTARLKKDRIDIIYNQDIKSVRESWSEGMLILGEKQIKCDLIVNASKRKGNIIKSDIEIETSDGYYVTDDRFETSVKNIFAVGDVNGKSFFAHIASAQGLNVINHLAGIDQKLDMNKLPMNMYSVPEAAQIGLTMEQAEEAGYELKISEFPLSANGKAQTEGNAEGFLRLISEKRFGEVLGVQIIAPHATDMINEAAAYMQLESTVYDIAKTVHTHPTISEVFMEAGFEAVDHAIHK